MKKLLATLLLFVSIFAFGQTVPQGINYQAIALDQMGQPVPGHDIVGRPIDDAEIGVRLTILENSPTGTLLYQEEHEVLTDLYGMFNLVIGQGLQVSPDPFSSIDWIGDKYLKVELSIENNGSFTLAAVQQLMSVPYAFLAENAMVAQTAIDVDDADADPTNEIQGLSLSNDTLYLSNGGFVVLPTDQVNDADDDPTNEIQGLSISNDTIYLSNGGFVTLPTDQVNDADDDPTNELQVLSITGDTIFLTSGGFIVLPSDNVNDADSDPSNEIQVLSLSNDTLYLSNGGFVVLPSDQVNDADNDPSNELQILSLSNDTIYLSNGGQIYSEDVGAEYTIRSGTTGGGTGWIISLERNGVVQPDFFRVSAGDGIALSGNNSTDYSITNLSNDMDSTNEIQTLSLSGDTLKLTKGGNVVLPSQVGTNSSIQSLVLGFDKDTTWTCPAGVTSITVEAWGAGGGGGTTNRGPSCGCSGCGPSVHPGLPGGKGGYSRSIVSVVPGTTYAIVVGEGGCSNQAGGITSFSNSVSAAGGGGATNSSYGCNSNWVYALIYQGSAGTNGVVSNWIYNDLYYSDSPGYIPQNVISNDIQYSQYTLATGGAGTYGCAAYKGEDGFLIIRY